MISSVEEVVLYPLWCWLASSLDTTIHFQSMSAIWNLVDGFSPQCKVVIKAALINILNAIWIARNNARFNNLVRNWRNSVAWISTNVTAAGNFTSKVSSSSIIDFTTLKRFNVNIHPSKLTTFREVIWQPPIAHWVKCNIDGASTPSSSACGGVFRNSSVDFLCGFANNIGKTSAFIAELWGAMTAIDIAASKNWSNLWLETDSNLVVMAFKSPVLVPWTLSNRWHNCICLTKSMNFMVSHVFREGNFCADSLANVGRTLNSLTFWYEIPPFLKGYFEVNRIGKPFFRVVNI
ncbi:hypothetical protein TSUD_220590 [Trifolium subterraneum]|uniref:RNase H type-1 domain-containing protein n=1 Tax=Trifolium subterraneum TaxID=3900 RepID=A0A2Z6NK97_TRISU|nr:hypothetical protein TSUD_220590 [Trifolium subterraneum]